MISRIIASSSRLMSLRPQSMFQFSQKTWKQRDDAAQKVYITQSEKQTMKKLLEKMNEQESETSAKDQAFERNLDAILNKYKVNNQAFRVEVLHLHKQL